MTVHELHLKIDERYERRGHRIASYRLTDEEFKVLYRWLRTVNGDEEIIQFGSTKKARAIAFALHEHLQVMYRGVIVSREEPE